MSRRAMSPRSASRRSAIVASGCLIAALAGCGEEAPPPLPDLEGATYVFPALDSVSISMVEGEGAAPLDVSTEVRAGVTDWVLHDDIDEDGSPDAVVVVWSSGEGDVTLYEVALLEVVEGAEGEPQWAWRASVPLGDRVRIRAMTLASDILGVHITRHGPDDEICCPTVDAELQLRVGERSLTEVGAAP